MTLIVSPFSPIEEPQLASGSNHNGGTRPPVVTTGQSPHDDDQPLDFALIAIDIARLMQRQRQTRRVEEKNSNENAQNLQWQCRKEGQL